MACADGPIPCGSSHLPKIRNHHRSDSPDICGCTGFRITFCEITPSGKCHKQTRLFSTAAQGIQALAEIVDGGAPEAQLSQSRRPPKSRHTWSIENVKNAFKIRKHKPEAQLESAPLQQYTTTERSLPLQYHDAGTVGRHEMEAEQSVRSPTVTRYTTSNILAELPTEAEHESMHCNPRYHDAEPHVYKGVSSVGHAFRSFSDMSGVSSLCDEDRARPESRLSFEVPPRIPVPRQSPPEVPMITSDSVASSPVENSNSRHVMLGRRQPRRQSAINPACPGLSVDTSMLTIPEHDRSNTPCSSITGTDLHDSPDSYVPPENGVNWNCHSPLIVYGTTASQNSSSIMKQPGRDMTGSALVENALIYEKMLDEKSAPQQTLTPPQTRNNSSNEEDSVQKSSMTETQNIGKAFPQLDTYFYDTTTITDYISKNRSLGQDDFTMQVHPESNEYDIQAQGWGDMDVLPSDIIFDTAGPIYESSVENFGMPNILPFSDALRPSSTFSAPLCLTDMAESTASAANYMWQSAKQGMMAATYRMMAPGSGEVPNPETRYEVKKKQHQEFHDRNWSPSTLLAPAKAPMNRVRGKRKRGDTSDGEEEQYRQCDICGRTFASPKLADRRSNIIRHKRTEHSSLQLSCPHPECNRKFVSRSDYLRNHHDRDHAGCIEASCVNARRKRPVQ